MSTLPTHSPFRKHSYRSRIHSKQHRISTLCYMAIAVGVLYGTSFTVLNVWNGLEVEKPAERVTKDPALSSITDTIKDPALSSITDTIKDPPVSIITPPNPPETPTSRILTAYTETIDQSTWAQHPLPIRNPSLTTHTFPHLTSCHNLPSQWPTDTSVQNITNLTQTYTSTLPTDIDPFLPWIHDVFPTADGKYIQFIAQNKRRCQSGRTMTDLKKHMQPNVALFQHVPIRRVGVDTTTGEDRYRLSSHKLADEHGIETRFLCHFQSVQNTTFSEHNVNYDWHTWRKGYSSTFTEEGFDNHMIWTSQLLFRCPVPSELVELVRSGTSIRHDTATQFLDLIPIRTPPRYGAPNEYFPPRYAMKPNTWLASKHWGDQHILPRMHDSGRWANIPICKPSLMTYLEEENSLSSTANAKVTNPSQDAPSKDMSHDTNMMQFADPTGPKKHTLIACVWASRVFDTRNSRTVVEDGERRLREWLAFHQLVGVDHVYVYDNSGSRNHLNHLGTVVEEFPGFVTRIDWPSQVCNNNSGTGDNKGERSSQYAALSSCRLRFGAHAKWLASMDTDEYLVPMGNYTSLKDVLKKVEEENIYILSFKSKRAKPRLSFLNTTQVGNCQRGCFNPDVPSNTTYLEVYNCDVEKPVRVNTMPAEKQIYRPAYVHLHFVHYSTITTKSMMSRSETTSYGILWKQRYQEEHVKFVDEDLEATMLHAKSIVTKETDNWTDSCKLKKGGCKLGIPFPPEVEVNSKNHSDTVDIDGKGGNWSCNCYPHMKIDTYWAPTLGKLLN